MCPVFSFFLFCWQDFTLAQAGFKPTLILLPQSPEFCNSRREKTTSNLSSLFLHYALDLKTYRLCGSDGAVNSLLD